MSSYSLLAGGYRPTFLHLTFDPSSAKLKSTTSPAPENASWIEKPAKSIEGPNGGEVVYSLSEDPDKGVAVSCEVGEDGKVTITGERKTHGGPAHVHCMKDGSGIVVVNYVGGTALFFPTDASGALSKDSESPVLHFEYPFGSKDKAPNPERQEANHAHQALEGEGGKLYILDLGADKVWVVKRKGESALEVEGWLQCPAGMGPRHAVFSQDGKKLYVLTEMGHAVIAFDIKSTPSYPISPIQGFTTSIIPPTVPETHQKYMDSAELLLSPTHPRTLYASNRWELHINEKNPDLPDIEQEQTGDAVAVIVLSESGDKVESIDWVRTGCDSVRGMQVSGDGKYVALAGQEGGGVEIWEVAGENGEKWKLAAKDESAKSVTDFVWL